MILAIKVATLMEKCAPREISFGDWLAGIARNGGIFSCQVAIHAFIPFRMNNAHPKPLEGKTAFPRT
jgi:hypothetical protein